MSGYNVNLFKAIKNPESDQKEQSIVKASDESALSNGDYFRDEPKPSSTNRREAFPFMKCSNYNSLVVLKSEFPCLRPLFTDISDTLQNAEYIVIRSTNLADFHKAMKYGVWSSSERNNHTLYQAFKECDKKQKHIYLFFTQVKSSKYMGVARMMTNVDPRRSFPYWKDEYPGLFFIEWVYIQSVSYELFKHIKHNGVEVASFRDGTRVPADLGRQMIEVFRVESLILQEVLKKKREKLKGFDLEQVNQAIAEAKSGRAVDTLSNHSFFKGPWWLIDHFETLDFIEEKDREERQKREINRKMDRNRENSLELNFSNEVPRDRPQRAARDPQDWPAQDARESGPSRGGRKPRDEWEGGAGRGGRGRAWQPQEDTGGSQRGSRGRRGRY